MPFALPLIAAALAAAPAGAAPDCARSNTVRMSPADTLDLADRFRDGLSPADRARLDRALPRAADGGIAMCDRVDHDRASCEAQAYMPALRSTGLMPRYLATICPRP